MNWIPLTTENQLTQIKANSGYSVVFKHSTRCSISAMAKKKIELDWDELPVNTLVYFLDLLNFRSLSANIANGFGVQHQSPQLLLIKNGECVLDQFHGDISVNEVNEVIEKTSI
jgi:bacillithiol system protein YtxJ